MAQIDDAFRVQGGLSIEDKILLHYTVAAPNSGGGFVAPVGSLLAQQPAAGEGQLWKKYNTGDTNWKTLATAPHVTTTDPDANDDSVDTGGEGRSFNRGDIWVNTTDDGVFLCGDDTATAAVWKEIGTGGGGEANTASNQGGASGWYKQKTGVDLQFYTFQAGSTKLSISGPTADVYSIDVAPGNINHNDLANKQGGTTAEYYHLTSAQHSGLTGAGDTALHYHSADRARAVHTGTQLKSTISDFQHALDGGSHSALSDITTFNASLTAHGFLPKLGGGTTNFLRADGTWAAPPGGSATPGGSTKQIQYNNAGAFGGASILYWDSSTSRLGLGQATPDAKFEIEHTFTVTSGSSHILHLDLQTPGSASTAIMNGIYSELKPGIVSHPGMTFNTLRSDINAPSAYTFGTVRGLYLNGAYSNNASATVFGLAKGYTALTSSGGITSVYGLEFKTLQNSSGAITNWYGVDLDVAVSSSGTITNLYGLRLQRSVGSTTLGTVYALYMGDMGNATTKRGVWIADTAARSYFGGAIGLGTTTDTTNGNVRWTGTDFEGRKGGAWVSLTSTGGETNTASNQGGASGLYKTKVGVDLQFYTFQAGSTKLSITGPTTDVYTLDVAPGNINHNDLANKQGGTTAEYYHLTSARHSGLTGAGDTALHYHSADRARAVHTGTQLKSTISDFQHALDSSSHSALTDITTFNASLTAHGFLPKLGGGTTNFLRADGTWAAPPGGSGETNTASNQGGASGWYKTKVGVDLQFYTFQAGSTKLSITGPTADVYSLDVAPGNIKLDDLGTPDDNTDLNATTGLHGLLPKLGGGSVNFLRADGTWAVPDIVNDASPELGGELDAGAHSIGFTLQTVTGDGTTTIDWRLGNKVKFTFGAMNETFTFTAPTNPCALQMIMVQDGTGGRTATWPANIKWVGRVEPTLSTAGGYEDLVSFLWDGTNFYGFLGNNFGLAP